MPILTLGAFEFGFGFADDFVGVLIFFGVFPGFAPELVAAIELVLGGRCVDFFGLLGEFGEDGDALGQDFDESASDDEAISSFVAAGVQANLARAEFGDERCMAVEDLDVAGFGRNLDRVRRLIDEDAVGCDEPDLKCVGVCHKSASSC